MKNNVWIATGLAFSLINSTLTASAGFIFCNDITGQRTAPNATGWGGWSRAIIAHQVATLVDIR
jgi:hypothetical protein